MALALALGTLGCGAPEKLRGKGKVLVRMTEWQLPAFEELVADFARREGVELEVESYQLLTDVVEALEAAAEARDLPVLVKVEARMLAPLRSRGMLQSLEAAGVSEDLQAELAEYLPGALELVQAEGATWGVPRKLESMVLAYRKAAVRAAALGAEVDREAFRAAARAHGLEVPPGHELEGDPAEWDLLDLLEAGFYMARVPDGGRTAPRFFHRTSAVEGTSVDLACLAYPLGYAPGPLQETPGFPRFLALERFAYAAGIYPPFDAARPVYTPAVYQAWKDGAMHLAFFQQIDAARLVGADPATPGFVEPRESVGFAPPPRAGSLAPGGGDRVPAGGWLWALPAKGPDPGLGYRLARYLTSREVHAAECRRFGMMPVRKDLAADLEGTFPDPVMRSLVRAGFAAWERRAPKPPLDAERGTLAGYEAWREAVAP